MKFYKQNKKRIDPRYFMDEKLEESVHDDDNMSRARNLAQSAMSNQLSGEVPPWESEDQQGDGFTDASLSEEDYDVLQWILKDLRIGVGRGNQAEKFIAIMAKLGISLDTSPIHSGIDVPESEAERRASGPSSKEIDHQWYGPSGHPYDR